MKNRIAKVWKKINQMSRVSDIFFSMRHNQNIVSWEPKGRYCCTTPFWFSTEHLWSAITPFWLSTDDIGIHCIPYWRIITSVVGILSLLKGAGERLSLHKLENAEDSNSPESMKYNFILTIKFTTLDRNSRKRWTKWRLIFEVFTTHLIFK